MPTLFIAVVALVVIGLAGGYLMTRASPARETAASVPASEPGGRGLAAELQRRGDVLQGLMYRTVPLGTVLCGTDVLGRSADGRKVYLWLECGEYATGSGASVLGEGAEAVAVTMAANGPTRHVAGVEIPSPDHRIGDIRRIFPASIRTEIYAGDFTPEPGPVQRLRIARHL